MNNEIQAGDTAENSTNVDAYNVKPLLAQNPMLGEDGLLIVNCQNK